MTTIQNNDRQATITAANYVVFSLSMGNNDWQVSFSKRGRSYKTKAGALRAAQKWVKFGK